MTGSFAHRAEALGQGLPPLLVAAERVAATVAAGAHGRRRTGQGDTFWQYRAYLPGDPTARIDWRQTAKTDRATLRETEWEAAQTVFLWRDNSAAMRWKSDGMAMEKSQRAELLLLALAALLLRGGERVALLGLDGRAFHGRAALPALADALMRLDGGPLPPKRMDLPRHARVVLFGDFLSPLPGIAERLAQIAAREPRGHMLQVLDPAECDLPYRGRVRFTGTRGEAHVLMPRVETVRDAYRGALAAQQDGLRAACRATGFGFGLHRTDHTPETALLALHEALSG